MKTMRLGNVIIRVKEKDVKEKLSVGYKYCHKQVWKDEVRVLKKKKEDIKENIEKKTKKG